MNMRSKAGCDTCGKPLAAALPGGLCSACAMTLALEYGVPSMTAFDAASDPAQSAGSPVGSANPPVPPVASSREAGLESGEAPGTRIGRYRLLQKIGEGGCGVVYMADQEEPVRRRVALKLIKRGMDTREMIGRFEQERQALAMMDHPSIAKVFDAGMTEHGRPFFVMELVKGIPITRFCDEREIDTRGRLALFSDVCSAINHAHQKGIIHRDIKPSNVMITLHGDKAVVKVIDFGIAKATQGKLTDKTLFTRFEQLIGTPAYMSPEQTALSGLDIDTRSDIYSLGVLLYELLTGNPPFDAKSLASAGYEEMRRIICEVEPQTPSMVLHTMADATRVTVAQRRKSEPSKLARLVRGDLDWIVMKALEKDRSRRYATANGLASDIARHLVNEPIVARPASRLYRLQRLARRNQLTFAASGAVAAAVLLGLATSLWQAERARKEAARAILAEKASQATLEELRAAAPAFVSQARSLAARERFDEAIEKLDYATKLRPDKAEYVVAKGDLLQSQLRLSAAAEVYREALRIDPGHGRAQASAELCDELLAAPLSEEGGLTRESLARLHLSMQRQQRPVAELMPVARLLGEEKRLILEYWLTRLKDLPVSTEKPLEQRLSVRADGLLSLDLGATEIAELAGLAGMPLGSLKLAGCRQIRDFSFLRDLGLLTSLDLQLTKIADLSPLSGLPLQDLNLAGTKVLDIGSLQGMKLRSLDLVDTRVADLSPLAGMPLVFFSASAIPATDYSPLAGAPLGTCYVQRSELTDLSFLRDMPVEKLCLNLCDEARGYSVLAGLKSLSLLILPESYLTLPEEELVAIEALRDHPALRSIDPGDRRNAIVLFNTVQPKEAFWENWDRERAVSARLRKSGFEFEISKLSSGKYKLTIEDPSFSDLSILEGIPIEELIIPKTNVTDLRPLEKFELTRLDIWETPVSDLSPLRAPALSANLRDLRIWKIHATDFSPLAACTKLERLDAAETLLADLGVVKGCRLRVVLLSKTGITDISPLAGMPLTRVALRKTGVTDIRPLLQCPTLTEIVLPSGAREVSALRSLPSLSKISYEERPGGSPDMSAQDFWTQ